MKKYLEIYFKKPGKIMEISWNCVSPKKWEPWIIIGGSLESPLWLFLAFCPKNLGGGGDLRMMILLENKYSLSDGDLFAVKKVNLLHSQLFRM